MEFPMPEGSSLILINQDLSFKIPERNSSGSLISLQPDGTRQSMHSYLVSQKSRRLKGIRKGNPKL